jgi:hypothetical protein
MKTIIRCAAIAGAVMFAAGSAAWAQNYTTTPGTQGSYSSNPGTQGYPASGASGANQQGWSSSQQNWNPGTQGTSTPIGSQSYSQAGYGMGNITTYQQAEQELNRYGYNNVHDLRAMQGWSADAMRNGQRVHVIMGDNGLIATFPGR